MRPLWLSVFVGSLVVACTIRTEVNGATGSTSGEPDTGAAPSVPGIDASASATADAAAAFDASATHDAPAPDAPSATPEAGSAADATSCIVMASDYDQTCSEDTDCVNVGEVLTCPANECSFCRIETISTRAAAQYMATFALSTAAIPTDSVPCGCPDEGRACCIRGRCQQCFPLRPLTVSR
ncbi:MAG TPA: hypothetical protein VF765_34045 [Polyangiaceae bacterium]